MTKAIAKWLALALCAMLTLSGCGLVSIDKASQQTKQPEQAAQTAQPVETTQAAETAQPAQAAQAADASQVVAEYDGGKITYDEAIKEYANWKSYYEAYGYTLTEEADITSLKQQVLDTLVQQKVIEAKAKEMGLTELTEDEKKSIDTQANSEYEDAITYYMDYLQGDTDEETRQNAIDYLNSIGYTLDSIKQYDTENAWQEELKTQLTKDVTVTDEQIKAAYDSSVAEDKQSFTEDTYNFENAATYGDTVTWVPEGYRAVKHILLTLPDEDATSLSDLQSQIEDVNVRIEELQNPESTDGTEEGDAALSDTEETDASPAPDAAAVVTAAPDVPSSPDAAVVETIAPDVPSAPDAAAFETSAPDVASAPDAAAFETAAPDVASAPDAVAFETSAPDVTAAATDDALASGEEDFAEDSDFTEDNSTDASADESASEDDAALENLTLPELQAKLSDLQQQLDALKVACIAKLQPKIDEIQAKIAAGEDFDKLIETYGQDDGMKNDPTKTNGYYVSLNSQMWDDEFTSAAMALQKVGDISQPVLSQSGVHIIKYIADVTPGAVPLEQIKDEIKEETLDSAKNDLYDKTIQEWVTAVNAKTYVDRLVDQAGDADTADQATPSETASN